MLSFIGVGNAFSYELGNCCAFYKKNNSLLLIDCGEMVFEKILSNNLLNNIKEIYILITHFHSDHVGSLGSLLFYCDKIGIEKVIIMYPNLDRLMEVINLFGVNNCNCVLKKPSDFGITEIEQKHSFMESFGYLFKIEDKVVYYSGDTKIVSNFILDLLFAGEIDYFYQDIRVDENDYHISIEELSGLIPKCYRSKINCMHYDINDTNMILEKGFTLVKKCNGRKYT